MNNPAQFKVVVGWTLLVLIGITSMSWLQPKLLREATQERNDLQLRLIRAEDGAAEIRALVAALTALRDSTTTLKNVPSESHFAGLIQDLNSRLGELGIEDREITNGGSIDLGPAKSIPMHIQLTSDFTGVFETIKWIESLPRLIRVQRIVIDAIDKKNPWDAKVKAEIRLDAVFDPTVPQETRTAVDSEAPRL